MKKDAALAKACAKAGDLLLYDVAKRGRVAWVAERFRQAGVKAETDACALLIEYVGEDDLHGLANEIAKIATWAQGEPVGVAEIEQLVARRRRRAVRSRSRTRGPIAIPGRCSTSPRRIFDRSDKPRRDTAPRLAGYAQRPPRRGCASSSGLATQGVPAREAADDAEDAPVLRREGLPPGGGVLGRGARRARPSGSPSSTSRSRAAAGSRPTSSRCARLIDVSAAPDRG